MSRLLFLNLMPIPTGAMRTMRLMQLPRAIRPIKFMTFTGNRKTGNHEQQETKSFHRAPPITAPHRNATPNTTPTRLHFPNHPATARAARSCAPVPPSFDAVSANLTHNAFRCSG